MARSGQHLKPICHVLTLHLWCDYCY